MVGKDYLREVQKFTSSQYWNSGVRITAGVMVPMLIFAHYDLLSSAMPFLWGALFVSLTDTPGPIHHRRNGMLTAVAFNTVIVLITTWTRHHEVALLIQIVTFSFFLGLLGVYGARAGAIGTLSLVIMLLNLVPFHESPNGLRDTFLIAAGGLWYTTFSLLLYRLQPYRLVEQALGENLIGIADYIRARAAFYKEGADIQASFNRVMQQQISVQKKQDQTGELLFRTRQMVADASPKSRSMMMIYLDSLDLFEQTMAFYQDYKLLHQALHDTDLLKKFYGVILQLAAELEIFGLSIQSGSPVKANLDFTKQSGELRYAIHQHRSKTKDPFVIESLDALEKTLSNIQNISNRLHKMVLYTRMEIDTQKLFDDVQQISRFAVGQSYDWKLLRENLTFKSNNFRYAFRLTLGMIIGYIVAISFSLSHTYWVLLTIVTILKPVYTVTRKRNIQRVAGTLGGIVVAVLIMYFISNTTILFILLVLSMAIGYSLLRVNYFGFVIFLTIYILITFHFLNPTEFKSLIFERLIDTAIGSVIAAIISRFILPVWGHEDIRESMQIMLASVRNYFLQAWNSLKIKNIEVASYEAARKEAMVALTNLSDNFQHLLTEPMQTNESTPTHQFVIANHMLAGHIAGLASEKSGHELLINKDHELVARAIEMELLQAEENLKRGKNYVVPAETTLSEKQTLSQLSIIYSLVRDIRQITSKL
jgi:uncharacterized membrane protein YccC